MPQYRNYGLLYKESRHIASVYKLSLALLGIKARCLSIEKLSLALLGIKARCLSIEIAIFILEIQTKGRSLKIVACTVMY